MTRLHLLSVAVGTMVLVATPLSLQLSRTIIPTLALDTSDARVGHPLTPVSVAGVNRRHNRRAAYGYGAGVVGAGLGAAAIGTAAAVGASPYYGGAGYAGGPYASYSNGSYTSGSYASYPAPVQNNAAFGTFCCPARWSRCRTARCISASSFTAWKSGGSLSRAAACLPQALHGPFSGELRRD